MKGLSALFLCYESSHCKDQLHLLLAMKEQGVPYIRTCVRRCEKNESKIETWKQYNSIPYTP